MSRLLKTGLFGTLALASAGLMPIDAEAAGKGKYTKPASIKSASLPYQTSHGNLQNDSPAVLVARALMGEVDNCPNPQEIFYVLGTIQSRVDDGIAWNGTDVKSVLLKKWQYCAFNDTEDNRRNLNRILNPMRYAPERFKYFLEIAKAFVSGHYSGRLPKTTHYYEKSLDEKGKAPKWNRDSMMKEVALPEQYSDFKHRFYFDMRSSPETHKKIASVKKRVRR
jgi:hypothetical protein